MIEIPDRSGNSKNKQPSEDTKHYIVLFRENNEENKGTSISTADTLEVLFVRTGTLEELQEELQQFLLDDFQEVENKNCAWLCNGEIFIAESPFKVKTSIEMKI